MLRAALIAGILLIAACDIAPTEETTMRIEKRDGLGVPVPAGRVVTTREGHLLLARSPTVRSVDDVTLWTLPPPPLPDGNRTESTQPAPHTIVTIEGGMGGPEYTLSIPKRIGGRDIVVRAYIQSEAGIPAFTDAWSVWKALDTAE